MTRDGRLRIGSFIHGLGLGHWRDPETPADAPLNIDYLVEIARLAESGLFDLTFIADIPHATKESPWKLLSRLEPMVTLGAVARETTHIGLAGTVSTSFTQPYDVARQFATLDALSAGRAGWNVVTSASDAIGQNYGLDRLPDHDTRYEIADEYLDVVRGLWGSWDEDALIRDKESGRYADTEKFHALDHDGPRYRVRGPLNIERSAQGSPVLFVAGASPAGKRLAARHADAVFANQPATLEEGQRDYAEWKRLTAEAGRNPDDLLILPSFQPIVGRTTAEAEERYAETVRFFETDYALANLSWYFNYLDLSTIDLDGPFPDDILERAKDAFLSTATALVALARREGLTVREAAVRAVLPPKDFVGSADDVADRIEQYFRGGVWDGVILTTSPTNVRRFIELVVPILQQRGLFRTEYEASTLRGNLGLARPTAAEDRVARRIGAAAPVG